ncbi:MAG: 1-phosphofructokinase [Clostridia bacterium]|nr:1-phosphofructokinase [Clostridia bacterium]
MIAAFTMNVSIDRRYVVANARQGAVNRVQECTYTAGGKGLNVARVLHTLGQDVIAGGIAGGDAGRYILRRLDGEGIAHRFTQAEGESRSCINILDQATGTQTEYLEPGSPVSEAEYAAFLTDFDALCRECKVITMSGSLPKGMDSKVYAQLIRRAADAGCKVLLDTSGASLANALDACPYYIKPNEDEIKGLVGCDADNEEQVAKAAKELHARGIANVVVSMGSRGAMLVCSEGVFRGVPPKIQAANTVGCGDSMTAAFAAATEKGMAPADALRYAVAVSAASAMSEGTGSVDVATFEELLPQVNVYTL